MSRSLKKESRSVYSIPPGPLTAIYLVMFSIAFVIYGVVSLFWGDHMLMSFSDLWQPNASISAGLGRVWFIFAWAAVTTFGVGLVLLRRGEPRKQEPTTAVWRGAWLSLNAGFFEELIWRWMAFFVAMVFLPAANWLTFGFVKWLYTAALIPLANWVTLGALQPQLTGHANWIFGAAVISANARFRNAHRGKFFRYVNSWFLGMVFFWLMFNYGLMAAIVAHILYDLIILAVVAPAFMTLQSPPPKTAFGLSMRSVLSPPPQRLPRKPL